jgi:hypothetical protein
MSSEKLENFLNQEQLVQLEEIGRKGDIWRSFLDKARGDRNLAEILVEIAGVEELGATPNSEKPQLGGPSPRVAAQKQAARRQG